MDLSIIIPCFNCAHKMQPVLEAVRSLPGNVEVIFIDDGSTDDTLEQLHGHGVLRQSNRGPGSARNHGVSNAAGRYIWFVDADDRPLPERVLRRLPEILEVEPDVAMFRAVCGGEELSSRWSPELDMLDRFEAYGMVRDKLFRRDFLKANGIGFSDAYSSEDNAFVVQAAERQGSALVFDEVIYEVLLAPDSICRGAFSAHYITRWRAVGDMLGFARRNARGGLARFERKCVFLSIGLTWSYYLERRRAATLVRLMPRMIASLRRMRLLKHLGRFLGSGSLANRAFKLVTLVYAYPLSFFFSGHVSELINFQLRLDQ